MKAQDHAPNYEQGYLRVPRSVWADLYCRAPLTRRQLQLVSVVMRESWGWLRREGEVYLWTRPLTPRQFARATGLSTDHLARDLQALLHRGVLREHEGRYQVVAEPGLWNTFPAPTPKRRSPAPKPPVAGAETALSPPCVKTANIRQRNVRLPPWKQLSPPGDKSLPADRLSEGHKAGTDNASLAERFLPVIVAFAGVVSDAETEQLRAWVREVGVTAVWQALEEAFRQGPRATRQCLRRHLPARERTSERRSQEQSDA